VRFMVKKRPCPQVRFMVKKIGALTVALWARGRGIRPSSRCMGKV
jgi:hypothetical protein